MPETLLSCNEHVRSVFCSAGNDTFDATLMPPNKKIAILGTRGIPARYGGFETFADEMAQRLVLRGHEVTVYCEQRYSGSATPKSYRGVTLSYINVPEIGPLSTVIFDLRCLWHARRRFDLVYMLGYNTALLCCLPRFWGTAVWINMDGVEWRRAKWGFIAKSHFKLMEAAAMWTANRIIADAHAIEEHLRKRHFRMPACSVIPYGAPICDQLPEQEKLEKWGLRPASYYLIVCRFEPENHMAEMIEAFCRSGSKRELIIVSNEPSRKAYAARVMTAANAQVRFVGAVYDRDEIQALRSCCFAYFHGHSVGGTNPSLLEAMGCGNLVLAHDNVFNREVLGDSGLFFQSADHLRVQINAIEAGQVPVSTLKAGAREIVRQRYTWEGIAERYCDLLEAYPERDRQAILAPSRSGD